MILESRHTDMPYTLAVMSGLAMHLWFVQVEERLGALSEVALEAAVAGYIGVEEDFLRSHRGIPLQERDDGHAMAGMRERRRSIDQPGP